jgi:hypothetical protein
MSHANTKFSRNINITRRLVAGEKLIVLSDEYEITKTRIAQIASSTLRRSSHSNYLKTGEISDLRETKYIQKLYVENKSYWLPLLELYEKEWANLVGI